ncbi:MAG: hypothetical protein R3F49_10120 [Planctomycetota bacterium]
MSAPLPLLALGLCLASAATAQTTYQIPLNYNFNGIVHAGEAGQPDLVTGYRSISDRGLDFSAGVPVHPLLAPYSLVSTAGTLDIVHLGNRNTVDNGNWAFDLVADGDNIGVPPTWLTVIDQSTPQVTTLAAPILMESTSTASFLYQISNGGGTFTVTFSFTSGPDVSMPLSAGDWFGGAFLGTDSVDLANPGNNLSITEGTIDLSGEAGRSLTSISFNSASNGAAGIAILAANILTDPRVLVATPIALNYNFNGIVHVGENFNPDDPMGFRSISDRALDFTGGVPFDPTLSGYTLVAQAGALDIVHLGNRNTVSGGNWAFDAVPDGDDIGTQPTWLANPDQSGPQTTTLAQPLLIANGSQASFIYQISNGGGSFDVRLDFVGGTSTSANLTGGDWFGGPLFGCGAVDQALPDANLSVTEGRVDLSAFAGRMLSAITFENPSNANAGYAILAANVTGLEFGMPYCSPAVANSTGASGTLRADGSPIASQNNLTLIAESLPNNSFGFFLTSRSQGLVMNPGGSQGNLCLGGAIGRYVGPGQIKNSGMTGGFQLALNLTQHPTPTGFVTVLSNDTWNFQAWYRDSINGSATSNFTSALTVLFQ